MNCCIDNRPSGDRRGLSHLGGTIIFNIIALAIISSTMLNNDVFPYLYRGGTSLLDDVEVLARRKSIHGDQHQLLINDVFYPGVD